MDEQLATLSNFASKTGPFFLSIAILPGFVLPVAPLLGFAGIWGGKWPNSELSLHNYILTNLGPIGWRRDRLATSSRISFQIPFSIAIPPINMTEWALILRLTLVAFISLIMD